VFGVHEFLVARKFAKKSEAEPDNVILCKLGLAIEKIVVNFFTLTLFLQLQPKSEIIL
jgi:hypothetical protein